MPSRNVNVTRGPDLFENWRAASNCPTIPRIWEFPLYSDAWFVGESKIGPYQFINTIAHGSGPRVNAVSPGIVLRINVHLDHIDYAVPQTNKTDTSRYHGGSLEDEVAALAALAMGARIEAGPISREFESWDVHGRPVAYYGYEFPVLLHAKDGRRLPWTVGGHSLEDLNWLPALFNTDPRDEVALIRAARLYQDAIWLADAEPALAWLLLVSAIETAADRWDESIVSPTEQLRDSMPDLVKEVDERCPDLLPIIAEKIGYTMRATRKFVDFTLKFLPAPPEPRPLESFQVAWDKENLGKCLRKIYNYRSKALHTGVPFPAPMCEPAMVLTADPLAPAEKPLGLATKALGGFWTHHDLPMALHIFEYIVRNVLKAWWSSLSLE